MPQKVNIPTIGTVWVLAKDWTFTVIAEHRNDRIVDYLKETGALPQDAPRWEQVPECGASFEYTHPHRTAYGQATSQPLTEQRTCRLPPGHDGGHNHYDTRPRDYARYACTVPRGTRLRVDRIYIRQGAPDFDSLTFWALDLAKKRVRFFAKLADVNTMVITGRATSPKPIKAKVLPMRAIVLTE